MDSAVAMEIVYPADFKGDKRKAFKQTLLHEHPESLYVDMTSQENRTNLIFYTERNLEHGKVLLMNISPTLSRRESVKEFRSAVLNQLITHPISKPSICTTVERS